MWLLWGSPKQTDDPWSVRRWIAVVAFRFLILEGVMMICLFAYAVMQGTEIKDLVGWGAIIAPFVTAQAALIGKYVHDATADQRHAREQEGEET